MIQKFLLAGLVMLAISCGDSKQQATTPAHNHGSTADAKKDMFKDVKFDADKDLVCGMPISAGVNDTAHYKGKVYGFCATECKDEFLKNPDSYLAGK